VACQFDVTGVPWRLADELLDHGVDFSLSWRRIFTWGGPPEPRAWSLSLGSAVRADNLRVLNGNHYTMFDQLLYAWGRLRRAYEGGLELNTKPFCKVRAYPHDFIVLSSTCFTDHGGTTRRPIRSMPGLIERLEPRAGPSIDPLRLRWVTSASGQHGSTIATCRYWRGDWTDFSGTSAAPARQLPPGLSRRAKTTDAGSGARGEDRKRTARAGRGAADAVDLYDEHTPLATTIHATRIRQAQTTELLKQALAHEGYELVSFALMERPWIISQAIRPRIAAVTAY